MKYSITIALCAIFFSSQSLAHDKHYPVADKMHDWFMTLESAKGPCCADADGNIVMDADWDTKDGHYRVRIDGQWQDIPDNALVLVPNKYGPTMVWIFGLTIRCFMPGAGG